MWESVCVTETIILIFCENNTKNGEIYSHNIFIVLGEIRLKTIKQYCACVHFYVFCVCILFLFNFLWWLIDRHWVCVCYIQRETTLIVFFICKHNDFIVSLKKIYTKTNNQREFHEKKKIKREKIHFKRLLFTN